MKFLETLGRFIYAVPFIFFGASHFMKARPMSNMMLQGWPLAEGLVYISGLGLILAGISIIINVKARLACFLLAALLLIFIIGLHLPVVLDGGTSITAMTSLLKDTALLGAALTYAAILKN